MSYASLTSRGSDKVRYALIIEGWPEIWVTDASITLTDSTYGARGRAVYVGLRREGLQFQDRALLAEGKLQTSSMRVRIVSPDHREQALLSFARVGQTVAQLAANLETDDLEITLQGGVVPALGYYHIGTEVIEVTNTSEAIQITRAHWDTQAQSFYLQDGDDLLSHQVYRDPRSAEGRRATLYLWGEGDDVTGYDPDGESETLGHPVWRGIVSVPPQLDQDGCTWALSLEHIHSVFKQSLCARATEIRPVGIQFNTACPLYIGFYNYAASTVLFGKKHFYFYKSIEDFCGQVTLILGDLLADSTTLLDQVFDSLALQASNSGQFYLLAHTVSSPDIYQALDIRSHLTGYVRTGWDDTLWFNYPDGTIPIGAGGFDGDKYYICRFQRADWTTEQPSDNTQTIWGQLAGGEVKDATYDPILGRSTVPSSAQLAEWNRARVFIDRDWSELAANGISISRDSIEPQRGPYSDRDYYQTSTIEASVVDSGFDASVNAYWIQVDDRTAGLFNGWVHADTVMRPTYSVATSTDVVGFVASVIDAVAANANDGNLPFIRDTDFDVATEVVSSIPELSAQRSYRYAKQVVIEEILAEELKLTGHMWSTDVDSAKLTFRPIPILTGNLALSLDQDGNPITFGASEIQTPEGGQGRWPSYEVQSQGLVSTVNIKDKYDAGEDSHVGTTFTLRDANLLSTHKRRGVTDLTIAPKSTCETELTPDIAYRIGGRIMSVLGREYATIKIAVPFTRFRVPLGSVVALTSPHVPNALGTRGVTAKRCIVVGRRWNLDPARPDHGELELLTLLQELSGYCPSGVITGQTGAASTWTLTLDHTHAFNILISPRNDGDVAGTFAVGDAIRILQTDNDDAESDGDYVDGTVTAVSGDTVSVSLSATWTPGSDGWSLEYGLAADAEDTQRLYCYVSGSDALIDGTEQTRSFG